MKDKVWYRSITVWGFVLIFVGAGLEAIGVTGSMDIIQQVAVVFGIPLAGIGIRKKLGEKK